MKTVDIMEVFVNAIEETIVKAWRHDGFICEFTSEHIDFEVDGKEYVLKIPEVRNRTQDGEQA